MAHYYDWSWSCADSSRTRPSDCRSCLHGGACGRRCCSQKAAALLALPYSNNASVAFSCTHKSGKWKWQDLQFLKWRWWQRDRVQLDPSIAGSTRSRRRTGQTLGMRPRLPTKSGRRYVGMYYLGRRFSSYLQLAFLTLISSRRSASAFEPAGPAPAAGSRVEDCVSPITGQSARLTLG